MWHRDLGTGLVKGEIMEEKFSLPASNLSSALKRQKEDHMWCYCL
jgi:hypothetical protein